MPKTEDVLKYEREMKKKDKKHKKLKLILTNIISIGIIIFLIFSCVLTIFYMFGEVKWVDKKTELTILEKIAEPELDLYLVKQGNSKFLMFKLDENYREYNAYKNRRNK